MLVVNNTKREITVQGEKTKTIPKGESIAINEIVGSVTTFVTDTGEAEITFLSGERRTRRKGNLAISEVSKSIVLLLEV